MANNLVIEEQKRITISDVNEVNGFSEKEIKLTLVSGEKVLIFGQGLKITAFAQSNGNFVAEGKILGVKYLDKSVNFIKKLIK